MKKAKEAVWEHCNQCETKTKHYVVATRKQHDSAPFPGYDNFEFEWITTYQMLECGGCESVVLKRSQWNSDNETVEEYFPPAVSRRAPLWRDKLPEECQGLLKEVYAALHADGRRLAMMGARTLVDMVMLAKVGDEGTFKEKLRALEAAGVIGKKNSEFLRAALDTGSAAAHRGHLPSEKSANHVMDIVENLLQAAYVLESAAKELQQSTPPRVKQLK